MLKITRGVKTIFSKIAGSKTATFLKTSYLFLYRYFLFLPKVLLPSSGSIGKEVTSGVNHFQLKLISEKLQVRGCRSRTQSIASYINLEDP